MRSPTSLARAHSYSTANTESCGRFPLPDGSCTCCFSKVPSFPLIKGTVQVKKRFRSYWYVDTDQQLATSSPPHSLTHTHTTAPTSSPPTTLSTETILGIVAAAVAVLVLLIICVFAFGECLLVQFWFVSSLFGKARPSCRG